MCFYLLVCRYNQVGHKGLVGSYLFYLYFPVTGAGCYETVVGGEGATEHLVIVSGDLCELFT